MPVKVYQLTCQHCGTTFYARREFAKNCSRSCESRVYRSNLQRKAPTQEELEALYIQQTETQAQQEANNT